MINPVQVGLSVAYGDITHAVNGFRRELDIFDAITSDISPSRSPLSNVAAAPDSSPQRLSTSGHVTISPLDDVGGSPDTQQPTGDADDRVPPQAGKPATIDRLPNAPTQSNDVTGTYPPARQASQRVKPDQVTMIAGLSPAPVVQDAALPTSPIYADGSTTPVATYKQAGLTSEAVFQIQALSGNLASRTFEDYVGSTGAVTFDAQNSWPALEASFDPLASLETASPIPIDSQRSGLTITGSNTDDRATWLRALQTAGEGIPLSPSPQELQQSFASPRYPSGASSVHQAARSLSSDIGAEDEPRLWLKSMATGDRRRVDGFEVRSQASVAPGLERPDHLAGERNDGPERLESRKDTKVSALNQDGETQSASPVTATEGKDDVAIAGDMFLDGALVGRWISRLLNKEAARASSGPTGYDIRRGRLLPGPSVGV